MAFWLYKTEPETFSYADLVRERKTGWNGVRNFQARGFLSQAKLGDLVLIYHSGGDRQVVGLAKVIREAYPDPDPKKKGEWVQVDLAPVEAFETPVTLALLKTQNLFKDHYLVRQSRLSVMPIKAQEFQWIYKQGTGRPFASQK